MIETTVQFRGLDEIEKALEQLPFEVQKQVLRAGLRAGGTVFVEGAKQRAPRAILHRVVRNGKSYPTRLADAITMRVRFRKDGDPSAMIGPGNAFWGRFVERGTVKMPAQPFMEPTVMQDGQIAVAAFAVAAKHQLELVVRRLRRSAAGGT